MSKDKDILKWLNRETSDKELMRLKEEKSFKTLEKIAHYAAQIQTPKVNAEKALAELKLKTNNTSKKGKLISFNFKTFYKYAAVLVVVLTTSYFLLFNNTTTINTAFAQTTNFNLPDNSEVVLNANSKIYYSKKDWKENRNLTLNGEAYFKVEKGKKFTVNTSVGKVTVLGTQFNVKERDNYFEVKTYEGLVSVSYKNNIIKMPKGSIFKVINNKIDTIKTFDITQKNWLQKESNFKSIPLRFVLAELENQFGYTIEVSKNIDTTSLFTGGFTHKNLNIALQSVTIPLQLSYKIEDKKITLFTSNE